MKIYSDRPPYAHPPPPSTQLKMFEPLRSLFRILLSLRNGLKWIENTDFFFLNNIFKYFFHNIFRWTILTINENNKQFLCLLFFLVFHEVLLIFFLVVFYPPPSKWTDHYKKKLFLYVCVFPKRFWRRR